MIFRTRNQENNPTRNSNINPESNPIHNTQKVIEDLTQDIKDGNLRLFGLGGISRNDLDTFQYKSIFKDYVKTFSQNKTHDA